MCLFRAFETSGDFWKQDPDERVEVRRFGIDIVFDALFFFGVSGDFEFKRYLGAGCPDRCGFDLWCKGVVWPGLGSSGEGAEIKVKLHGEFCQCNT